MNNFKITVVLASYNSSKYICESIDSIINQTYKVTEIIVIDDGSSDGSLEMLQYYEKRNLLKLFKHEHCGNIGMLLNQAIYKSSNQYIAIMSADDVWQRDKIEKQIAYLKVYNMICTNGRIIDGEGKVLENLFYYNFGKDSDLDLKTLVYNNYVIAASVLLNKSILAECGYFEQEIGSRGEDYILWLRIAEKYKIRFLNEPLVDFRKHNKNLSNLNLIERLEILKRTVQIKSKYLKHPQMEIRQAANLGSILIYKELLFTSYRGRLFEESKNYCKTVLQKINGKRSISYLKYLLFYLYLCILLEFREVLRLKSY